MSTMITMPLPYSPVTRTWHLDIQLQRHAVFVIRLSLFVSTSSDLKNCNVLTLTLTLNSFPVFKHNTVQTDNYLSAEVIPVSSRTLSVLFLIVPTPFNSLSYAPQLRTVKVMSILLRCVFDSLRSPFPYSSALFAARRWVLLNCDLQPTSFLASG